jgi:hypothetical protein
VAVIHSGANPLLLNPEGHCKYHVSLGNILIEGVASSRNESTMYTLQCDTWSLTASSANLLTHSNLNPPRGSFFKVEATPQTSLILLLRRDDPVWPTNTNHVADQCIIHSEFMIDSPCKFFMAPGSTLDGNISSIFYVLHMYSIHAT